MRVVTLLLGTTFVIIVLCLSGCGGSPESKPEHVEASTAAPDSTASRREADALIARSEVQAAARAAYTWANDNQRVECTNFTIAASRSRPLSPADRANGVVSHKCMHVAFACKNQSGGWQDYNRVYRIRSANTGASPVVEDVRMMPGVNDPEVFMMYCMQ